MTRSTPPVESLDSHTTPTRKKRKQTPTSLHKRGTPTKLTPVKHTPSTHQNKVEHAQTTEIKQEAQRYSSAQHTPDTYTLTREIGRGAYGIVYQGNFGAKNIAGKKRKWSDTRSERIVAIKIPHSQEVTRVNLREIAVTHHMPSLLYKSINHNS